MAIHFSIVSVFLLLPALSCISEENRANCSILRYGKLKMFSGEERKVEIPCKYRLADYTCGDYHIKVTPGSKMDGSARFSPNTVWVSITYKPSCSTQTKWIARTSSGLLEKASTETPAPPVWNHKLTHEGGELVLVEAYWPNTNTAVVKHPEDLFKVQFSKGTDDDGVLVTCEDVNFTSKAYPKSLCGLSANDPDVTQTAVRDHKRKKYTFPNLTNDQVIVADVLGHTGVVQSGNCKNITLQFQNCTSPNQVAKLCTPIFTRRPVAKCLVEDDDVTPFEQCQSWVCSSNGQACTDFRKAVEEKCTEFGFNEYFPGEDFC